MTSKSELRKELRAARKAHVEAQPANIRALLFHRPPGPVMKLIDGASILGLYSASAYEAPTSGYARFFHEHGYAVALPSFDTSDGAMAFRTYHDPIGETGLVAGPHGIAQPGPDHQLVTPDIVFTPLVGFTTSGVRLGQGGGHYDRWLAAHPTTTAIGLAWDVQLRESLPVEKHDIGLRAVITPTRIYGLD